MSRRINAEASSSRSTPGSARNPAANPPALTTQDMQASQPQPKELQISRVNACFALFDENWIERSKEVKKQRNRIVIAGIDAFTHVAPLDLQETPIDRLKKIYPLNAKKDAGRFYQIRHEDQHNILAELRVASPQSPGQILAILRSGTGNPDRRSPQPEDAKVEEPERALKRQALLLSTAFQAMIRDVRLPTGALKDTTTVSIAIGRDPDHEEFLERVELILYTMHKRINGSSKKEGLVERDIVESLNGTRFMVPHRGQIKRIRKESDAQWFWTLARSRILSGTFDVKNDAFFYLWALPYISKLGEILKGHGEMIGDSKKGGYMIPKSFSFGYLAPEDYNGLKVTGVTDGDFPHIVIHIHLGKVEDERV